MYPPSNVREREVPLANKIKLISKKRTRLLTKECTVRAELNITAKTNGQMIQPSHALANRQQIN